MRYKFGLVWFLYKLLQIGKLLVVSFDDSLRKDFETTTHLCVRLTRSVLKVYPIPSHPMNTRKLLEEIHLDV